MLQSIRRVGLCSDGRSRPHHRRMESRSPYCRGMAAFIQQGSSRGSVGPGRYQVLDGDYPLSSRDCRYPVLRHCFWRHHPRQVHLWQAQASKSPPDSSYTCPNIQTDLFQARAAIFDVNSTERAYRVAYALDYKLHDYNINVSEVLYRKYTPNHFSRASLICKEWYSNPSNRFSDSFEIACEVPQSSYFTNLHPKSTDSRRGSWMSSSPSASYSCSSSENGDEPLTPNTPIHEGVHPFSAAAAKENVAPTPTRVKSGNNTRTHPPPMIGQKVPPQQTNQSTKWTNFEMQQGARPALQALPPTGDLAVPRNGPHHMGRRLSN